MTANRLNFRVWDKKNKCFLENFFIDPNGQVGVIYVTPPYADKDYNICVKNVIDYCNPKNIEVMQSTGMVDKNGKEIFEGDFLKDYETGDILNVQWREDGACFGATINENWQDYDWRDFSELDMYIDIKSLEIIGNEYENPDCWRIRK